MSCSSIIHEVPDKYTLSTNARHVWSSNLKCIRGHVGVGSTDLGARLYERMNEGEKILEWSLIN